MASAVDAGIEEGVAGLLAAVGSALSLLVRVVLGIRADRRRDYGFASVAVLLVAGAAGFGLLATETAAPFVIGALLAFALGWGWPGLFNLAVVDRHREAPRAATGISQSGIYVGAAGGPAAFGAISAAAGYAAAWGAAAGLALLGATVIAIAGRRVGLRASWR